MLKIRLTSIQSSYLKGMRAHHSIPSRSRRDTPSLGAISAARRWRERQSLFDLLGPLSGKSFS
jgi:hypothetical protein